MSGFTGGVRVPELDDELEHEDSGVYGAILDLRMGPIKKLEVEWVGVGPHAHSVERAKANLAACRAALDEVSRVLAAQGKRDVPIRTEGEDTNG